ncbi:MAG: hypothetical protein M3O50_06755 [Myxococcota bacterium]|nr:hypothetical protein [Myxococcota bacterium]
MVAPLLVTAALACHSRRPSNAASAVTPNDAAARQGATADPLDDLHAFEEAARATADFEHGPNAGTSLGPDPYVIRFAGSGWKDAARLVGSGNAAAGFLGILRGRNALVALDGSLRETARWPAPESPSGLAVASDGSAFVVGELSPFVARYRRVHGALQPAGSIDLPGVRAMRDVATGPEGVVYVVEEHDGRLLTLQPRAAADASEREPPAKRRDTALCRGPLHVMRVARSVLVDCLLDHAVVVRDVDPEGFVVGDRETRIVHDGPIWGFDAIEEGTGLLVATAGVEDHPLDRREGSFGFIDSFVTLYRVDGGKAVKLAEVNTSAIGVVTPKALTLSRRPGALELAIAGYGSDRFAFLEWTLPAADGDQKLGEPTVEMSAVPPGSAMMARSPDGRFVLANPLIDAWVQASRTGSSVIHVDHERPLKPPLPVTRLGEALFFTTLMAPWDSAEGRLSRFTCETCHFEGYVDGRTHHTGRGDIRATTKPLLGLFNNRPYFSRALDPDLATMVDNEFRAAGAKSGHDSWFSLAPRDFPWTKELAVADEVLSPVALRRALMSFLMTFGHRPNPAVIGRSRWTDVERAGAVAFRDACESCHQARLVTDDPTTRLPFAQWEEHVLSRSGAIVWARPDYAKTGVLPYVNENGARVVSLRRLYKKHPYFTNGSATDIDAVLSRVRSRNGQFLHDGSPEDVGALTAEARSSLSAFLDLL